MSHRDFPNLLECLYSYSRQYTHSILTLYIVYYIHIFTEPTHYKKWKKIWLKVDVSKPLCNEERQFFSKSKRDLRSLA